MLLNDSPDMLCVKRLINDSPDTCSVNVKTFSTLSIIDYGIAEVMGSNPAEAPIRIFSGIYL